MNENLFTLKGGRDAHSNYENFFYEFPECLETYVRVV